MPNWCKSRQIWPNWCKCGQIEADAKKFRQIGAKLKRIKANWLRPYLEAEGNQPQHIRATSLHWSFFRYKSGLLLVWFLRNLVFQKNWGHWVRQYMGTLKENKMSTEDVYYAKSPKTFWDLGFTLQNTYWENNWTRSSPRILPAT